MSTRDRFSERDAALLDVGEIVVDVVRAAWVAAGRPQVPGLPSASVLGCCARCGDSGRLVEVRRVVSRSFTGRDHWTLPGGAGLCSACTWAYQEPALRKRAHIVLGRRQPVLHALDSPGLLEALSSEVDSQTAVTLPRSGRKHLLPGAQWGRVLLDDIALPWSRADAARLTVLDEIRRLGASDADLRHPAPPWPLIHTVGPAHRPRLLQAWDELRAWRTRPAHLEVALIATRRPRGLAPEGLRSLTTLGPFDAELRFPAHVDPRGTPAIEERGRRPGPRGQAGWLRGSHPTPLVAQSQHHPAMAWEGGVCRSNGVSGLMAPSGAGGSS